MIFRRQKRTNSTVLVLSNGTEILISYDTPVAYISGSCRYKTNTYYSVTTSRHINSFFSHRGIDAGNVEYLCQDKLAEAVSDMVAQDAKRD